MSASTHRPTRRDERRAQTLQEIKALAMDQIGVGGPDAVSLSGIVREMAMSPAAIYRYFASRDALLADLVVDSYNQLADSLDAIARGAGTAAERLTAVLNGGRTWALAHPNAYRLIFQTSIGSGKDFAVDRTVPAASRSMSAIIGALSAAAQDGQHNCGREHALTAHAVSPEYSAAIAKAAQRSGLTDFPPRLLALGFTAWTRLHGIISLELGGHITATGIDPDILYQAEVAAILRQVVPEERTPSAPEARGT